MKPSTIGKAVISPCKYQSSGRRIFQERPYRYGDRRDPDLEWRVQDGDAEEDRHPGHRRLQAEPQHQPDQRPVKQDSRQEAGELKRHALPHRSIQIAAKRSDQAEKDGADARDREVDGPIPQKVTPARFPHKAIIVAVRPPANPFARWRTIAGAGLRRLLDPWRPTRREVPMRTTIAHVFAVLIAVTAGQADAAVGFQHFSIDDPQGPPIEVGVWYPTTRPRSWRRSRAINRWSPATRRSRAPVCLWWSYRTVTEAPMPGISTPPRRWPMQGSSSPRSRIMATAGATRAVHRSLGTATPIEAVTDYMLGAWSDHGRLDANRVGAFGFSAGGFTVLAAAGGEPDLQTFADHCKAHPPSRIARSEQHPLSLDTDIVWIHDPRIKAVVSAAPALGFAFGTKGLAAVRQPVQLWRAEDDQVLPHPYYAEAVRLALPNHPRPTSWLTPGTTTS